MTATPNIMHLGAIGLSPALLDECKDSLRDVARVEALPPNLDQTGAYGSQLDAILIGLGQPLGDSVADFCRSRRRHPLVPFVAMAEAVDADFATELLKCGAEDFMLLPASPGALRHKVLRALGKTIGPAFDRPELAAFRPQAFDVNQRHCFRVCVTADYPVISKLPGPVDRALDVKDLSIETDSAPGGLQLAADRATARTLPFDQWNRRKDIELSVQLPKGSPIAARARLIPGLRNGPDGSIRFAVEYWVTRPADKQRFRRYWVEAQRRLRRIAAK